MTTKRNLTPVVSSNIDAVGFDARDGLLVRFKGGQLYGYPQAPRAVHDAMLKAESAGSFFRSNVRGTYAHKALDG